MTNHLLLDTKPSTILKAFKEDLIQRKEYGRVFAFNYLKDFVYSNHVCVKPGQYACEYLKKGINKSITICFNPSGVFAMGIDYAIELAEANHE